MQPKRGIWPRYTVDIRHSWNLQTTGSFPLLYAVRIESRLYFSYTYSMKTAISIPDNLFNEADTTAKQLGLARSQLYVKAIKEFIEHHNKDRVMEKLNTVYSNQTKDDDANDAGLESLREATKDDSW